MIIIGPCNEGFPVFPFSFTPKQISSPVSEAVWFTIAVPKAAKGHGDPLTWLNALFAWRIQCARVWNVIPLIIRFGAASITAGTAGRNTVRRARAQIW